MVPLAAVALTEPPAEPIVADAARLVSSTGSGAFSVPPCGCTVTCTSSLAINEPSLARRRST